MKKICNILVFLVLLFSCVLIFCFYQTNANLIEKLSLLETENTNLKSNLNIITEELYQIKHSPENLIQQIRNEYENQNYSKVKELANELHSVANGTSRDVEAQTYVKNIVEVENKNSIEKAKEIIEVTSAQVKKNYYYYYDAKSNLFKNMSVEIAYKLKVTEPVQKLVFSISAQNSNGEIINFKETSSATRTSVMVLLPTLNAKCVNTFEQEWTNMEIKKIIINSITITYYDGSTDVLTRTDGLNFSFEKHTLPPEKTQNSTVSLPKEKTEEIVYITSSGTKYHKSSCSYLKSSISIGKEDAIKKGYTSCSKCNP